MLKYKAVLFDLDGTLINTLTDLAQATNYMLREYGYPEFPIEDYKYKVGNGMRKLVERALPEGHKTDSETEEGLKIFLEYYNKHSLDNTAPYDGIVDTVKKLREMGVKIGVVTNKAHNSSVAILDKLMPNCFDVIVGQKDGVPTKPAPDAPNAAAKALGVTADECIFVGDSCVDMQTAHNFGAYAVGVKWGFRTEKELRENGANAIISEPSELIDIVK